MNYRHHFHAGNFADVLKHAILLELVRGLQRKEKGFLYLDTHAGRGFYDLAAAERGDTRPREPEYPGGIGRLWSATDLPPLLEQYVRLVRTFTERREEAPSGAAGPRYYPGSPWLVRLVARPQDRLALCERHPEECAHLSEAFRREPRVSVHPMDGYTALRALLPPPEKRALVLLDPPFESATEYASLRRGLGEGLRRLPGATFALWYPLTERARVDAFFEQLRTLDLPPTWVVELARAGGETPLKLRGCGLVVVNPPWRSEEIIRPALPVLATQLADGPGGGAQLTWLVPE